ncbi:uncharacterized protein LOC101456136 [Ceratitis capitata]|uniref:(Mediterranean fruit fly) hypothetical protein n=1 Tax=Ceratitis capitata TaxID=7213 RepID=A0A811VJN9_CERCA|nr:uncharacterized protein LOC101456136 [Ceratitis capitata]CAD7014439.1 unnamed protein product [Ceratitis capitata]
MAGSNATKSVLGELAKRVPSNQTKQFRKFLDLNSEYKRRVDKYPKELPRIDWDYYRTNVRVEAIKMVDEFEKKYEELNKIFDDRFKVDTRKYYDELEKQRAEVQAQVRQYIAESNERIKAFESEIARLCHMKPYSAMTMEEFINLRPECSAYIPYRRKPLFWPHDPDEQIPGSADRRTFKKSSKDGGGDGDGEGVSGGTHPIKPGDIMGKTEKFEFDAADSTTMQEETDSVTKASDETELNIENPQETQELPVQLRKKPHPCALVKHKPDSADAEGGTCKPKGSYKDRDRNTSKFFDPCGVGFGVKKRDKSYIETVAPKSDTMPQTKISEVSSFEEQPKEDKVISKKVVKSNEKKAIGEPQIYTDKPTSKEMKARLDPCQIMEKEGKEKAETKETQIEKKREDLKTNTVEEKPVPPKRPHPCDLIEQLPDDLCKPNEIINNEKDTSAFLDPCNVGFGPKKETGEAVSKVKSKLKTKSSEKLVQKFAEINRKAKKDITCNTKDEQKETSTYLDPCGVRFGAKEDAKPFVEKITKKTEPTTQAKEYYESSSCNLTKQRQNHDTESCKDHNSDVATNSPCNAAKKQKEETIINKDKNSLTMVNAEPKEILSKDDDSKRQSTPSKEDKSKRPSPATPYYNPFRSEEENKKIEDDMCGISKTEDPCSRKIRGTEEEFYDPCKDEKE